MRRTTMLPASLLAASSLLLVACGQGGPSSEGSGGLTDDKIVLAVLNDQSGVYAELSGKNSVEAVEMAVEDFKEQRGDEAITQAIEVVSADHQNEPEVANTKAQELYDRQKADIILDVPTSSAALAVATQAKNAKKLFINITAATTELTGAQCNKYTFHYAYDTYMLANGTGNRLAESGEKNWYIVYPDYAFGQDMTKSFTAAVEGAGGQIVKADAAPFPNDNFSTFMLKAPSLSPKPDVLGAMQAGGDLVNLAKQYNEFKLKEKGIGLAVGLMFDTDIKSIGPDILDGTLYTTAWFWNLDAKSREWADRFKERTGTRPTFAHAGNYSAAMQYLEAVQRAESDDSDKVVGELEGLEFEDFFIRNGTIRPEDHRVVHDAYLAKVKPAAEVKEDFDFSELVETIPAEEAFKPVAETTCSMPAS